MAIDPFYGAMMGMGGRILASAGQGDPLAKSLGLGIVGGLGDYASISQQAQMAKQRDLQTKATELAIEKAEKLAEREAGAQQRVGSIISQYLGGRGLGASKPLTNAAMQSKGIGQADAYMPAAAYQEELPPDIPGFQSAMTQEAITQAGLAGDPSAILAAMKPAKPSAQEGEISRLVALGVPRDQATKVAAGVYRTTSPDPFGNVGIIDLSTQKLVSRFNIGEPGQEIPTPVTPETAPTTRSELQAAAKEGTGPVASWKRFVNATVGTFTEGIPYKGVADATSQINIKNKLLEQTLVSNPKFPVMEMERVRGMLADPNKIFTDPDVEANKYVNLEQTLVELKAANEATMPRVSTKERERLANQNATIDRGLTLLRKGSDNPYLGLSLEELDKIAAPDLSLEEIRMLKEAYKAY